MVYDVAVIGAGIGGASAAFHLSEHAKVLLLEAEDQPGRHATGRSAAILIPGYGSAIIQRLTAASRGFFDAPPKVFGAGSLLTARPVMTIVTARTRGDPDAAFAALTQTAPNARRLSGPAAESQNPFLAKGAVREASLDPSAADIDVDRLLQGFLRGHRQAGGETATQAKVTGLRWDGDLWRIETSAGPYQARKILNAAGAWADAIVKLAGGRPIGLGPRRRSACLVPLPADLEVPQGPMTLDLNERFYFKPEAGHLLISPAEERVSRPCDAAVNDLDLARGIARAQPVLAFAVTRVSHSWAGLRTFAADRNPVIGADDTLPNFHLSAGQGGYGVQTAPAWGAIAAYLLLGRDASDILSAETAFAVRPRRFDQSADSRFCLNRSGSRPHRQSTRTPSRN